jgi:hypothetical protein
MSKFPDIGRQKNTCVLLISIILEALQDPRQQGNSKKNCATPNVGPVLWPIVNVHLGSNYQKIR